MLLFYYYATCIVTIPFFLVSISLTIKRTDTERFILCNRIIMIFFLWLLYKETAIWTHTAFSGGNSNVVCVILQRVDNVIKINAVERMRASNIGLYKLHFKRWAILINLCYINLLSTSLLYVLICQQFWSINFTFYGL